MTRVDDTGPNNAPQSPGPPVRDSARLPVPGEAWVIWVIWMTYGAFYFCRTNISAAVPGIGDELGFSNLQIGWILASLKLTYALGQFVKPIDLADGGHGHSLQCSFGKRRPVKIKSRVRWPMTLAVGNANVRAEFVFPTSEEMGHPNGYGRLGFLNGCRNGEMQGGLAFGKHRFCGLVVRV